jgi:hypothetical protein
LTAKHEEHQESAEDRFTTGEGSSAGDAERKTSAMSFSEMMKMMDGMDAEEMSRMGRACCPDESICDCCDWMLRRTFADSREAKED